MKDGHLPDIVLHDRPQPTLTHLYLLALLAVGVIVVRWALLATFGSDTPYWDQWDGEIAVLYKPFVEGTLTTSQLFSVHNEHRIVFSRVFNLALFALNEGQFDNLVETYANAVIYAISLCTFVWFLLLRLERSNLVLGWLAALAIGIAPYATENLLVGFQNAFYFLTLFAFLGIASVAFGTKRVSWAIALLFAVLSQFVLASGLLLGPALAFVGVLRWRTGHASLRSAVSFGVAGVAIGLVGFLFVPTLEHHAALKAQNLGDFLRAMLVTTAWPMQGSVLGVALMWFPSAIALWRAVVSRRAERTDLYLLGVGAWIFLQQVAVAHTRGHELTVVPSRYTDLMAFAPLVNVALAVRIWQSTTSAARRKLLAFVASLSCIAVTTGFISVTLRGFGYMEYASGNYAESRANLRAHLDGQGLQALSGKPGQAISYPVAARLDMLLRDPTVRAMLPPSIQPPSTAAPIECSAFVRGGAYPITPALPGSMGSYRQDIGNASIGTCTQGPFEPTRSHLLIRFAGYPLQPGMALQLRSGPAPRNVAPPLDPKESWLEVAIPSPQSSFDVAVSDSNPEFWFAYTPPIPVGRLSALAIKYSEPLNLADSVHWH